MTLVAISGIDGCGKSMQIEMTREWLIDQGHEVFVSKAYDDLMKVQLRPLIDSWDDQTAIMFLFQALHAKQCTEAQLALSKGAIVLADRWDESYTAYHSNFGFLAEDSQLREKLNLLAFRGIVPSLGFMLTVPTSTARRRREGRGKVETLEDRPDSYYEKVQATQFAIANERGWKIIDGTLTPDEVQASIRHSITSHLNMTRLTC